MLNRNKHYCHNCSKRICDPNTGEKVFIGNTLFYIIICKTCNTEHQFIKECGDLQCHSTQRPINYV